MKQHTTPCGNCPFLRKMAGAISGERAEEIANDLRRDTHFWCHKTLSPSGSRVCKETRLCAGSMIVTEKGGERPSQHARILMRIGMLDFDAVQKNAAKDKACFDDLDEFVQVHEEHFASGIKPRKD